MAHFSFHKDRLIIFGRYPLPGRAKTRLIPALGAVGAADLQRRLTEGTLTTARKFRSNLGRGVEMEVSFEGGSGKGMRRWLGSDLLFSRQTGGDIGERMHAAFLRAFKSGCRRVVLMGTDIPGANVIHLKEGFDALLSHDLVLGPAFDGGYWLMGLKLPADLFRNIHWSSGEVLDQTLKAAKARGLTCHQLAPQGDIDTWDDVEKSMPGMPKGRPYLSVIIPALNEEKNIEATIRSALDPDAEVIVVDGGSRDGTGACAAKAGARVVNSPRGRALQQNFGAQRARGHMLLFLHADTRLPGDYINHVFTVFLEPETALGAFRFKTDLNSPSMRVIEFVGNIRSRFLQLPYGDQALFTRKSLFESIGGFPEVPIAEDLFFSRRISRHGPVRIAPASVITSARRWRIHGALRTTLINQMIVAGVLFRVSPSLLASIYHKRRMRLL